jgi:hypothetical protein
MIIGKNVRVEVQKQSCFVGASGSIQIADDDKGKLYLNVDGGPSIAADPQDVLEVIQRAITERM